jgi:hypothetical protein
MSTMVHENVLVAFFSQNDITFHSYKPDLVITIFFAHHQEPSKSAKTLTINQTLKTIWSALIDSKHPQSGAWEKSPALFDNSMGNSLHKIFSYHLSSLAKLLCKRALMHSCTFFPNPPRLVFVN